MKRGRKVLWLSRLVLVAPVALLAWAAVSELVAGQPGGPSVPEDQSVPRGVSPDAPRAAAESAAAQEDRRAETLTAPAEPAAAPSPEPEPRAIEDAAPDPTFLERYVPDWSRYRVLEIAVWQIAAAFAFILLGLVARKITDYVVRKHVSRLLDKTQMELDNLVVEAASKPLGWAVLLVGMAAAVWVLALPAEPTNVRGVAFAVLKVLLVADLLWFLFRLVDVLAVYLTRLAGRTDSSLDDQLVPLIRKALKVTLGLLLAVWVVQLLGYNISSLLAGLGVGGLAVALALQDTLANFFGSVFIFLDRPFMVGDMVEIEGAQGTVEQIGFRSTRIRTWPATLVSIPNKTVAATKIDNWSAMPKRRVFQTVGVTYETTADQMEEAVAAVRKILENDEGVDQDYIVVRFSEFGASSLDILVLYFTRAVPYADHMATKERVNLAIMRALRGMGLSIAFPTQTVYFEGDVAQRLADRLGGDGKDAGNTVNHR